MAISRLDEVWWDSDKNSMVRRVAYGFAPVAATGDANMEENYSLAIDSAQIQFPVDANGDPAYTIQPRIVCKVLNGTTDVTSQAILSVTGAGITGNFGVGSEYGTYFISTVAGDADLTIQATINGVVLTAVAQVVLDNSPTYADVTQYPPTNNVSNVVFTSSQNADASIHIVATWDYTQGARRADGAFVYRKSNESAPGAFNYASNPMQWVRMDEDGSFSWEFDVPAMLAGTNVVLHYRFGVVAGMGPKLNTGGAVTPTGWDDITFTPAVGDIDLTLEDRSLRAYTGQGVQRRAVQIGHESVDWLDCPDTTPASPELLRARIGRLGVGPAVLMDGELLANIEMSWGAEAVVNAAYSYDPVYIQLADGELRVAYQRGTDGYIVERIWSGSAWGAETVVNAASSGYPAYIQLASGELRVAYWRGTDNYLIERTLQRYARIGAGIIERGNGYIWFSDGTVIEWGNVSYTVALSVAFIGGYRSSGVAVTLPLALDAEPDFISATPTGLTAFGALALPQTGNEAAGLNIIWTAVSSQASAARTAKWFVIGRKAT